MARTKGKAAIEKKNIKLERLKIEYVPIDSITPNEYNPNRQSEHDFELLKKSMDEDGFTQPVLAHVETKQIVDGEHRWRAARDLGFTEIPVVFVDMTAEQMRISTLRHNRARGEEDIELTAQVLRDLQELGALDWAADSLQMTDEEINRMIDDIDVPEALAGEEFGEAWEPSAQATPEVASVEGKKDKAIEGTVTSAATREAVDAQREREKRIAEAKTEEEKETVRREMKLHRLNLVFSGDEAELIEEVMGRYPAEKLVVIARYWKEHNLDEQVKEEEATKANETAE